MVSSLNEHTLSFNKVSETGAEALVMAFDEVEAEGVFVPDAITRDSVEISKPFVNAF